MRTVWHYCIIALPLVFAFSMLGTITDSILTKAVPSSDTGKAHQRDQTGLFPLPLPFFGGAHQALPSSCSSSPQGMPDSPVNLAALVACGGSQWRGE